MSLARPFPSLHFPSFRRDRNGASAVEFALVAPLMILLLLGGYAYCELVSIARKVTITTRALADLTTQYTTISDDDMATIMQASKQIIAPFDGSPLTLRISEVVVQNNQKKAKVVWSSAYPDASAAYKTNAKVDIPDYMGAAGTTYILSEVTYPYTPPVGAKLVGSFNLADKIFMLPRVSTDIDYNGS